MVASAGGVDRCDARRLTRALIAAGALALAAAGPSAADIVINEVLYDPAGGDTEFIELYNNGGVAVDVGGRWICAPITYWQLPSRTVPAGGFLVVRWNQTGTDTELEVYTGPMRDLNTADGIGLYTSNLFDNPADMLDFVQWGGPNQPRSDVAEAAGIWVASDFVSAVVAGRSQSLFPDGVDNNSSNDWGSTEPSPGAGNAVPVEAASWGVIKNLYSDR